VRRPRIGRSKPQSDLLAYKVEIWDAKSEAVAQILAVTSSSSIGYAAYYAATREFPEAIITLSHDGSVMSRWDGRPN
jgi:hypothetical protein